MNVGKWNSRKVLFGIGLVAIGVAVELISPRGLTETVSMFLIAIGAAYFAGNVGDKLAERNSAAPASSEAPSVELMALEQKLNELITVLGHASTENKDNFASVLKYIDAVIKTQEYIIKKGRLE